VYVDGATAAPTAFRQAPADDAAIAGRNTVLSRLPLESIAPLLHADTPGLAGGPAAWLRSPVAAPLAALLLASIVLIPLGGDRWLADRVFAAEGGHWALRNSFLLTRVLHGGGKALSALAWLSVFAMSLRAAIDARWKPSLRPLLALLLSVAISTLLVSTLKHLTRMDCPWDAAVYGGSHPYFTLLQARPAGIKPSGCFPAGQASAGYARVALYFFFASVRPAWRRIGLAIGVCFGLALGIAQQLRGAHYLSHDLWTLAICWFVALAIDRLFVRRTVHPGTQAANDGDRSS
jgi:membrane-associated PAP2 superfamily phosphatase